MVPRPVFSLLRHTSQGSSLWFGFCRVLSDWTHVRCLARVMGPRPERKESEFDFLRASEGKAVRLFPRSSVGVTELAGDHVLCETCLALNLMYVLWAKSFFVSGKSS